MSEPFRTPEDYELFLYTLSDTYPSIRASTLRLIRLGATLVRVVGEVLFDVPAPQMSFNQSNLPALIREIEELIGQRDS